MLDSLVSLLSTSLLLLIITLVVLWIGNTFFAETTFEGSFTLRLRSTREETIPVRRPSTPTASPVALAYSESFQDV